MTIFLRSLVGIAPIVWLAGISAAWAALVVVAPAAPAWLAAATYFLASHVCHQLPDRSFHLDGLQLAVCARCTGIYAAAPIVFGWLSLRGRGFDQGWTAPRGLTPRETTAWLVAGAVPTLATIAVEWLHVATPSNGVRALAGISLGWSVAWVVGGAARLARPHIRPASMSGPS